MPLELISTIGNYITNFNCVHRFFVAVRKETKTYADKSKSEIDKTISNKDNKGNIPSVDAPTSLIKNAVFIGSTKELLDKIIDDDKRSVIIDIDHKPAFKENE